MWLPFPPNRSLLGESLIYSQLHLAGSWWYYSTFRPAVMNANDDWGNTEGYLTWPKEVMIAGMVQIKKYWVSFMAAMLSVFEGHEMWQKVHYMKRALGWKWTYASHVRLLHSTGVAVHYYLYKAGSWFKPGGKTSWDHNFSYTDSNNDLSPNNCE